MVTRINPSMGMREWMLLILLSVLWGGSFFFVGVAVNGLPPFTIVASARVPSPPSCCFLFCASRVYTSPATGSSGVPSPSWV